LNFAFENGKAEEFIKSTGLKISKLQSCFKIFHQDMYKPTNNLEDEVSGMISIDNIEYKNIDKLLILSKYKENLAQKFKSLNLIQELITIYQKVRRIYHNLHFCRLSSCILLTI